MICSKWKSGLNCGSAMWDTAGGQVQRVKHIMWRTCDASSYEGHGQKAEIKWGIMGETNGVGRSEEFDELR